MSWHLEKKNSKVFRLLLLSWWASAPRKKSQLHLINDNECVETDRCQSWRRHRQKKINPSGPLGLLSYWLLIDSLNSASQHQIWKIGWSTTFLAWPLKRDTRDCTRSTLCICRFQRALSTEKLCMVSVNSVVMWAQLFTWVMFVRSQNRIKLAVHGTACVRVFTDTEWMDAAHHEWATARPFIASLQARKLYRLADLLLRG